MTLVDPIGDMFTRIRNGQMVRKPKIDCPASKIKVAILKVLQEEAYIRNFEIIEDEKGRQLEISLKYFDGKPVIKEISKIYEETYSGTLEEVKSFFEANHPKGEFVIVVEGIKK